MQTKEEILQIYDDQLGHYQTVAPILATQLSDLLSQKGIKYHLIEKRIKDRDSLSDKLDKNPYQNIGEIPDIIGLRIIVYYQTDMERTKSILESNFEIDENQSESKINTKKDNEFGYLSDHYVLKFEGLNIEVQVRTVLQHAWASISHELQYKNQTDIPSSLKRKLNRLAGLFELADEQFLFLKEESEKYRESLETIANASKEFDKLEMFSEINYETLRLIILKEDSIIGQFITELNNIPRNKIKIKTHYLGQVTKEEKDQLRENIPLIILLLAQLGLKSTKQMIDMLYLRKAEIFGKINNIDQCQMGNIELSLSQTLLLMLCLLLSKEEYIEFINATDYRFDKFWIVCIPKII